MRDVTFVLLRNFFFSNLKNLNNFRQSEFFYSVVIFLMVKKSRFLLKSFVTTQDIAFHRVTISVDVEVLEEVAALAEHSPTKVALEPSEP